MKPKSLSKFLNYNKKKAILTLSVNELTTIKSQSYKIVGYGTPYFAKASFGRPAFNEIRLNLILNGGNRLVFWANKLILASIQCIANHVPNC